MNGIYIHIPFCNTICSYCDFPKRIAKEEEKNRYVEFLLEELNKLKEQPWFESWVEHTQSIYIGGGTPNSLNLSLLERIFKALEPYLRKSKENTIEINPELLTEEQAHLFARYHINRVSIGVQTFQSTLLKKILRTHTKEDVTATIQLLDSVGIYNINLDMMYGLPSQTMKDLKKDVHTVLSLNPKHISYYSLIKEEKTILDYQLDHNQIVLPDDDSVVDMANYLTKKLKKKGFNHYEISNYAKDGYASVHNLGYWNCEEYIGIGAGACGYHHNNRWRNSISLKNYYQGIVEQTPIDLFLSKQEFMMLGLRKLKGISIKEYYSRFKTYPKDDFELVSLYKNGLIEEKNDFIRIKEDKIWLGNLVFQSFVGGTYEE